MNSQPPGAPAPAEAQEWLSLHEASELLGINASTLRRWGDSGKVPMRRTLGGHRRFARDVIARLAGAPLAQLPARIEQPTSLQPPSWSFDSRELARQEWHARFTSAPLASRMRGLGQRLLGLLIQYVNRREDDQRFLREARAVGASYGGESRAAGASLHDTVEAFLFFRGAFSQLAMPLPGIALPTDLAEAIGLHARINRFMDAILLGLIAGFAGETGSIDN